MRSFTKSVFAQSLAVFGLVIGITLWTAHSVYATHQQGWKYWRTSAYVENRGTSYDSAIKNAVSDYSNNTDLTVYKVASNGDIVYIEGNYGNTGWDGGSQPLSASNQCFSWPALQPTGYCNKTNHKVDFGYLYINTYYDAYEQPQYGMRHEMGHVWGISHESCGSTRGIMEEGQCRPNVVETLNSHDRFELRFLYP